ncbi:hypothetical protein ACFOWM_09000 [Ferruginibacter yonginensis]|uniref:Uncharacterized protein n=1 Tax=Ferruginibacter yonginensis TaxID=1310416 RepID=A0ABV8QT37_9BACT
MAIKNLQDLEKEIAALEIEKATKEAALKTQFHATLESYQPQNILKTTMNGLVEPGNIGSTILKAAGGIGVGLLAKNFVLNKATNYVTNLASSALQSTAKNAVNNNKDKIAAWATAIYKNLFNKKK